MSAWRSRRVGGLAEAPRPCADAAFARRRLRRGLFGRARLFMAFDRGRIAREMTDQPIGVGPPDQGLVHHARQFALGEFGEGARERRFAGNLGRTRPTTKDAGSVLSASTRSINVRVVGKLRNRLGDEGSGQGGRSAKGVREAHASEGGKPRAASYPRP